MSAEDHMSSYWPDQVPNDARLPILEIRSMSVRWLQLLDLIARPNIEILVHSAFFKMSWRLGNFRNESS